MTRQSDAVTAPDSDELVIAPTLADYRDSINLLHFGGFTFFVQAWRLKRANPRAAIVVGSLFTHVAVNSDVTALNQPRCILGRDPSTPARFAANFATLPDGEPTSWTARDVTCQTLTLIVPAVAPWIPAAVEVRLKNRRQI